MTPRPRRSAGWLPNQHGAWFMLAAPVMVGIATSRPRLVHLPLVAFWLTGYCAFFAGSQWLKSRFRSRYLRATVTYAAGASTCGTVCLALEPTLLRFAWWFVLPAALAAWAAWRRQERTWWAGVATVAAAMLFTPVVNSAGGGGAGVWRATAVLAGYFVGTVLYVKSMIRERGNVAFRRASVAFHGVVALAEALLAWGLLPLFATLAVRAAVLPRYRLTPKHVGLVEMVFSLLVCVAAVAAA